MKTPLKNIAQHITALEIWVVTTVVVLSMAQTSLLPWAVLVALLFWPIRWMAYGRPSPRTPVDLGIIVLLLLIPVTLWATALPEKTIPQVYRLALGILFFYALISWANQTQKLGWLITGLLLAGTGLAGLAIVSVRFTTTKLQFIPTNIYQRFEVLVSDAVHPNVMAGSIVIILPLGLALLLFAGKQMKRWQTGLVLLATLFTAGILILTQSRGALMAVAAAVLLLSILRWRWGWVAVPLAGLGAALVISRLGIAATLDFIASGVSVEGLEGRIEIWSRAIYMIQDFSFTGVGMGSYMDVADLLYPFFLAAPGKIYHAHNLFLQIAVDLGFPGFIAWFAIFLGVCLSAWQLYQFGKNQQNQWFMALGAGFLGCQLALISHGVMDAVTWGMVRPAPLVWAIWGTAIAARLRVQQLAQTTAAKPKSAS